MKNVNKPALVKKPHVKTSYCDVERLGCPKCVAVFPKYNKIKEGRIKLALKQCRDNCAGTNQHGNCGGGECFWSGYEAAIRDLNKPKKK